MTENDTTDSSDTTDDVDFEEVDKQIEKPDRAARWLSFEELVKYETYKTEVPDGFDRKDYELLLGTIQLWWITENKRPSVSNIVTLLGWPESKVVKGLRAKSTYYRLRKRGIAWPENWSPAANQVAELTPQQVMAIQILTDPTRPEKFSKRLGIAGINYNVFRNWMRNPKFAEAYKAIGESMITDNINTVHNALVQKAEQGDATAMKLFYEVSGRHDPMRQQTQDLTSLVGLLLEVITRHITDVGILTKINNDFSKALSGDSISPVGELTAYKPTDIEDAVIVEDEPPAVKPGFFEL